MCFAVQRRLACGQLHPNKAEEGVTASLRQSVRYLSAFRALHASG